MIEKPWYVIWIEKELSRNTKMLIEDWLDDHYNRYDIVTLLIGIDGVYAVVKERYEQKSNR